jgi:8-oxo-dGTP pyrophosphatase MutT (NUDIX family)
MYSLVSVDGSIFSRRTREPEQNWKKLTSSSFRSQMCAHERIISKHSFLSAPFLSALSAPPHQPTTMKRAGLVIYHPHMAAVLLVRDTRTDKWSFPKGRAESYDRDLITTAIRETHEETGFVLNTHYKLTTTDWEFTSVYLVRANALTAALPFTSCAEQHVAEVAWVHIRDILRLNGNAPLRGWAKHMIW